MASFINVSKEDQKTNTSLPKEVGTGRKLKLSLRLADTVRVTSVVACGLALMGAIYSSNDNSSSLMNLAVSAWEARSLSSLAFPRVSNQDDVDNIIDEYEAYLKFALVVGKDMDSSTASKLDTAYRKLRKNDRVGAARFLKGLRFEMLQKLEFMGASANSMKSSNVPYRRWIGRFLREWLREADEYHFRSYSNALARRQTKD